MIDIDFLYHPQEFSWLHANVVWKNQQVVSWNKTVFLHISKQVKHQLPNKNSSHYLFSTNIRIRLHNIKTNQNQSRHNKKTK
jgi:hypothetical protein